MSKWMSHNCFVPRHRLVQEDGLDAGLVSFGGNMFPVVPLALTNQSQRAIDPKRVVIFDCVWIICLQDISMLSFEKAIV